MSLLRSRVRTARLKMTDHARRRARERGVDEAQLPSVLEHGTVGPDPQRNYDRCLVTKDGISLVVDRDDGTICTVWREDVPKTDWRDWIDPEDVPTTTDMLFWLDDAGFCAEMLSKMVEALSGEMDDVLELDFETIFEREATEMSTTELRHQVKKLKKGLTTAGKSMHKDLVSKMERLLMGKRLDGYGETYGAETATWGPLHLQIIGSRYNEWKQDGSWGHPCNTEFFTRGLGPFRPTAAAKRYIKYFKRTHNWYAQNGFDLTGYQKRLKKRTLSQFSLWPNVSCMQFQLIATKLWDRFKDLQLCVFRRNLSLRTASEDTAEYRQDSDGFSKSQQLQLGERYMAWIAGDETWGTPGSPGFETDFF